jgi:thiamine-monophosphate kinase
MGQLPSEPEIALEDEEFLEARFYQPTARLEWVPWLREHARSAIDISDGLLVDTEHMADASGCGLLHRQCITALVICIVRF